MKHLFLFLVFFSVTVALGLGAYLLMPEWWRYLFDEDYLVETLSAAAFLAAGVWGLLLVRAREGEARWAAAGLSAFALIGFLDEISFGERWFGFRAPVVYWKRIHGPHDLIKVARRLSEDAIEADPVLFVLVAGSLVALCLALAFKPALRIYRAAVASPLRPVYLMAVIAAVLLAASQAIDQRILFQREHREVFIAMEELFELNAGLALLVACFALSKSQKKGAADGFGRT